MSKLSRRKKALFALVSLVAVLTMAEVVLRVHDFSFYYNFGADMLGMPLLDLFKLRRAQNKTVDFDPYLFWKFKPDQVLDAKGVYLKPARINHLGYRGRDWPAQKPLGVYRVVCIGDSTTFGWSVGDAETYPHHLRELLSERCAKKVEVLNLGVTGYTSLQGRELMLRHARGFEPDLVIFAFGPNDRLPALRSDLEHLDDRTWDMGAVTVFMNRFQLYKLLKSAVVYAGNLRKGLSLDPATYIPKLKRKVSEEQYAENVRAVKKACDEMGAGLVLVHVDYPSLPLDHVHGEIVKQAREHGVQPPPGWSVWDGAKLHRELSAELDVPVVLMRPLFAKTLERIEAGELDPERARQIREGHPAWTEEEPWWYLMVDNGHPNDWGHRVLAAKLAEEIEEIGGFKRNCEAAP